MSDRMNQKRRRAYEEKEKKFMENHKRNKKAYGQETQGVMRTVHDRVHNTGACAVCCLLWNNSVAGVF